jgi:hypothetical protein
MKSTRVEVAPGDSNLIRLRSVKQRSLIFFSAPIVILILFPVTLWLTGIIGCSSDRAIASGQKIEFIRQFEERFPAAEHFISYYTGTHGPPTWNSHAGIHGRYVLSLQMPIELGGPGRGRVLSHGTPTFYLLEIVEIHEASGGTASISYGPEQLTFELNEWARLVKSGGDLRVLGIKVNTTQPVPGFDKRWRSG